MNEIENAGFQVTMDEEEMNVFVVLMTNVGPITPTTPIDSTPIDYLPIGIGMAILSVAVVAVAIIKRRSP